MSINNIDPFIWNSLNNTTIINCDEINTATVTNLEFSQLAGIHTNQTIQQQIDAISGGGGTATQGYWGQFFSTQDQVATATNTAYTITFNNSDPSNNGINLASGSTTRMTFSHEGVYYLQYSVQFDKTSASSGEAYVWFSKNGTSIPSTNSIFTLAGSNAKVIGAVNILLNIAVGDYVELKWLVNDTTVTLHHDVATGTMPAVPSVIFTANQIINTSTGPQGEAGVSPIFSIGSVTNTTGSPAVSITGTTANPVLNFVLKQGEQGPQGEQGEKGDKGNKGDTGDPLDPVQLAIVIAEAAVAGASAGAAAGASAGAVAGASAGATSGAEAGAAAAEAVVAGVEARVTTLEGKTVNQEAVIGTTTFTGQVNIASGISTRINLKTDGTKSEFADGIKCESDFQMTDGTSITSTGDKITIDSKLDVNGILSQNAETCYLTYNTTSGVTPTQQYIKLQTIPTTGTKNEILFKSYDGYTSVVDYDSRIYCEGGDAITNSFGNMTVDTNDLVINSRGLECAKFEYPLTTPYAGRLSVSEIYVDNIVGPTEGFVNFDAILTNDITASNALFSNIIYREDTTLPFELCGNDTELNVDIGNLATSGSVDIMNGSCVIDKDANSLQLAHGFQLKIKSPDGVYNNRISTGSDGKFYIDADTARTMRFRIYNTGITDYQNFLEINDTTGVLVKGLGFSSESTLRVNEIQRRDTANPFKLCDGETTANIDILPVATSGQVDFYSGDIVLDKTTGAYITTGMSLWLGDAASDSSTQKIRLHVNSSGNQYFDIGNNTSRLQMRIGTTLKYDFNGGDLTLQSGGMLNAPNVRITNKTDLCSTLEVATTTALTFPCPEIIFVTGTGNYTITLPEITSSANLGAKITFIKTNSNTNSVSISIAGANRVAAIGSLTGAINLTSLATIQTTRTYVACPIYSGNYFWREIAPGA